MHVHRARAARGGGEARGRGGARAGRELRARDATGAEDTAWDDLVQATGRPHILQSRGWALAKAITGWEARRYVLDSGVAQVLVKRLALGVTVAYAPRGPLVPDDDVAPAMAALRDRLWRCAALLCDPEVPPTVRLGHGIRRAPVYVQPRRTLILDPSTDPDALLAAMRKKTRQYIRKAERAGVLTEETADLGRFHRLLASVGRRDRFAIRSLRYLERLREGLGERLHVLMATAGGEDVGGLMLARMGDRAWELYGGWSGTHAEDRPFYLLKWRALLRMAQLGARRYDMWGLSDPRSGEGVPRAVEDPLAGVTEFKLGFGGHVVEWVGALETPVTGWLYPAWRLVGRTRLARSAG